MQDDVFILIRFMYSPWMISNWFSIQQDLKEQVILFVLIVITIHPLKIIQKECHVIIVLILLAHIQW